MNKNQSILILLLAFYFSPNLSTAQTPRAKGFIFDANRYNKRAKTRKMSKPDGTILPTQLSLRGFCPTPQDQEQEASCTAWAIAYGALTIQQAIQRRVQHPKEIERIALSKSFVFNQLCHFKSDYIPSVEETFQFLKKKGTCLSSTFGNDAPVAEKPDTLAQQEAQDYRIDEVIEVFDPFAEITAEQQIRRLKRHLLDSLPLVVGLRLPYHFQNCATKVFAYDPNALVDSAAHALTLIGYDDDDATFELMNSWGTQWGGDGGFIRIHYRDLIQMMCCAYKIVTQYEPEKNPKILRGSVVLRQMVDFTPKGLPRELRVQYDTVEKCYKPLKINRQVETECQIILRQVPMGWWVYALNHSPSKTTQLIFSDKINYPITAKLIPNETSKFQIDAAGDDWLIILFCEKPIPNIQDRADQLTKKREITPLPQAVNEVFKDQSALSVKRMTHRMAFELPQNSAEKTTVFILKF